MRREEQIMNFIEAEYKKLALANPAGLTPEGQGYLVGLGDVIRFVDKLPKEPEPKGLDEAAIEYLKNKYDFSNEQVYNNITTEDFKAGAKWMAEQGESKPAEVCINGIEIDCGGGCSCFLNELSDVFPSFKPGDKVIVQIRKKDQYVPSNFI